MLLIGGCAGPTIGAETAEEVAQTWERALDQQPGPPLWIIDAGFQQLGPWPDGDPAQGAPAGRYTLRDASPPVHPPPRSIVLGSGGSRMVDVLSAAATVEVVQQDQTECTDDCAPMTLTDPTLVDVEVTTVLGPTVVPAWEFRVSGSDVRLRQVAIDPAESVQVEGLAGVLMPSRSTAEVLADGAVQITFDGGPGADDPCGNDNEVRAAEFDRVVMIDIVSLPNTRHPDPPDACGMAAQVNTVDVHLDRPLADRILITSGGAPIGITGRAD
jgi:hypothetical protein